MLCLSWILSILVIAGCPASARDSATTTPGTLQPTQSRLLSQWYGQLGVPGRDESFGDFLVRAALLKHHDPYERIHESIQPERIRVDLTHFDCVSFIDTSLAVARCAWLRNPTETCFLEELIQSRYRQGTVRGFASRLHYFEEWLDDNRARGRIEDRTPQLGGVPLRRRFFYMSENRNQFPPMNDAETREAIALTEMRLSRRIYTVVVRSSIRHEDIDLRNGDVVSIVTTEPGRLISHAGFVVLGGQRSPRLLHASSHHRQVTLTAGSLFAYVLRRDERWGIMVARPLPPVATSTAPPSR